MNGAGETYTTQGGTFSQMFVSSAGYLGAMAFGAVMLVLIRRAAAARVIHFVSAFLILFLTFVFGFLKPIFSGRAARRLISSSIQAWPAHRPLPSP